MKKAPATTTKAEASQTSIVFDQILIRKLARRIVFGRPMDNHAASSALVVVMEYMRDEEDENARFNFFNYFMMELAPFLKGYDENLSRVSREALADVHASEYGDSTHND